MKWIEIVLKAQLKCQAIDTEDVVRARAEY